MAECRLITSPKTGEKVTSETWNQIFQEVGNAQLADKLYSQLLTPKFLNWFGNWTDPNDMNVSKVVNMHGEPMVLFHSSTKNFNEFKEEFSQEIGFHFGTELSAIERHSPWVFEKGEEIDETNLRVRLNDARADLKQEIDDFTIYPVFLNIRNMIEGVDYLDAEHNEEMSQEEYDTLYNIGRKKFKDEKVKLAIAFHQKGTLTRDEVLNVLKGKVTLQKALNADGYWYVNRLENKGAISYVVFDMNDIKSIKNNGQYSLTNNDIYYNLKLQGKYSTIQFAALDNLTKNNFVHKYNPDDTAIEDRWYFNQSIGLDESQRLYHQYMSLNNLNRDMFKEGITKNGVPYLVPNYNFNLKDSIEENNDRIHKEKYEAIIDFFVSKFGISRDKINYITKKEFAEKFPDVFKNNSQSVYYKGKFYFFTNNLTADITVEELLHPFIFTVKEYNKQLFNSLLEEAKKSYPLLTQKIQVLYKDQPQSIRDQEIVTQALSRVFNNVYENQEPKTFLEVIKDFVNWIKNNLNELFNKFSTGKFVNIDISELDPRFSLEQIAQLINATDTKFDIAFPEGSFYNLSTNPEDFNNVITTLLTDKRVDYNVEKILVKLPEQLKEVKKRLVSSINDNERKELQNVISNMEELAGEDKQNLLKAQLKGIITTVQLFNTLEDELNTVDRSDMDDNLKLSYYMSILKTANALNGFKDTMLELNNELRTYLRRVPNPNVQQFNALLSDAIKAKDAISFKIQNLVLSPVLEELVKTNEYTYKIPLDNIDAEIKEIEDLINKIQSQKDKDKLFIKVKNLNKEKKAILDKAPTRENLKKVFDGMFKDANQLSYIFESKVANGHPVINTLQGIINELYDTAGANMLPSKNEAQTVSDIYTKESGIGLRDTNKRYAGVADDLVSIPVSIKFKPNTENELDLDKDGKIQFNYVNQNTLITLIDNQYITDYKQLEMIKEYYRDLHVSNLNNNVKDDDIAEKYKIAFQNFEEFKKENVQRQYTEEYYNFRAMLDEKVGDTTVKAISKDIYDEIDKLKDALLRADSTNRETILMALKIKRVELRKLKSTLNSDGTKKNENELKVANVLNEYSKKRYEYGEDFLTEEGQTKYNFDLDNIESKRDQYTPEEYKEAIGNIQQRKVSEDYYEALSATLESINELSNRLAEIYDESEIGQALGVNSVKEQRKDIYNEIREITKPYRDEDQVINGVLLTQLEPDLVGRIREMQQYIEDLKFQSTKITSLSPSESEEYKKLRKNKERTDEEDKRHSELFLKKEALKKFKRENIEIINELNSLFKELSNLSDTSTTEYYNEMVDEQIRELSSDEDIVDSSIDFVNTNDKIELDNGAIYIKKNNKWYSRKKVGKKLIEEFLGDENQLSSTGTQEMIDLTIAFLAHERLKESDWWKENHYTYYTYNKKSRGYVPVEKPIYIWEHTTPSNPNFIEILPAKGYYTYKVKDAYVNNDYGILYKGIPLPKSGKYINSKYAKTKADPAKFKFLNYLTDKYNKVQELLPDNYKMGHVLPAVIKTEDENAVNATNNILSFNDTFKNMFAANAGETDTDTSYLLGGSQIKDKAIPIRFTGLMDTSKQTKDALASILLFEYHLSLYKALNDKLPLFEATQLLVSKVGVLETKNEIEKLGFFNKVRKVFSPNVSAEEKTQQKVVEKTILSKTVDSMIDTFVYGQRVKPMIVSLPVFGNVDLAKVSGTVLGWAAKSIFIGNIISSINNSLSTRLQAIVNSGVKSKLYSLNNLKNAQAKSFKYFPDFLKDWTKLGNKSLIGQVLDHFAFLAENPSKEITKKTSFTYAKNKVEFLTSPKQMSEFEVLFVQFLTIADNTLVKINGKNNKLSNIEDVFEIGKDGNLKLKDGVEFTKQQETIFRNKFQAMARKLQGAYRQTEISTIETNWAGKSALFLRRYFVAMAVNRFGGGNGRWNSQEMEIQIGYQKETFNNLVKLIKDYQNFGMQHWAEMTDKEKASFYKTLLEYGILITFIALLYLGGGDDDKKKLKENSWAYNMMLVVLLRAKSEMEQFTLKGTDDLIRIGKNPFMAFTTFGNMWKIIGLSGPTIMGSDMAFYKQNTGLHEKGDSKLVATFLKLIGYTGATWHPEEYYINFKNAQNR